MSDRQDGRTRVARAKNPGPESGARVFFALWPDPQARQSLDRLAREAHEACAGRPTRAETIHLTLVFVGQVDIVRIASLKSLASRIAVPSFDLRLDHAGYWKHNRIVWLGARETPPPLAELVRALEQGLEEADFRFDKRPYVPHLTLVRKALCREPVAATAAVHWPVREFVLARSSLSAQGAAYEIIGRWPLR